MLNLIPAPYRIAAVALAFALVGGISFYRGYHTGYGFSEARYAAALAQATVEAAVRQKALIQGVDKAAQEAEDAKVETEKQLAAADASAARLRAILFAPRAGDGSAATPGFDATTLGAILADCVSGYRDMAKEADRLRATVIGLQGYARAVSR